MNQTKNLLQLSKATAEHGGKAANLAALMRAGYRVPDGFVIPSDLWKNDQLDVSALSNIEAAAEALGWPVAVRSSANVEDGAANSFAGQFETVLHIADIQQLTDALSDTWQAQFRPHVRAYAAERGIDADSIRLHLVVQKMIKPDVSGVAFTVNPLTGHDCEVVIEAVRGYGDALVGGEIEPSRYVADWFVEKVKEHSGPALFSDVEALALAEKLLDVGVCFGFPADVEWGLADGELWLFQSRPITNIHVETRWAWTNADFRDGGVSAAPATPMMTELYRQAFETSMPRYLRSVYMHPPYAVDVWFAAFVGCCYWNLTAAKDGALLIPGFSEKQFDDALGIPPTYEGEGRKTGLTLRSVFNGIRILIGLQRSIRRRFEVCDAAIARANGYWAEVEHRLAMGSVDEQLLKRLTGDIHLDIEGLYFETIFDSTNLRSLFMDEYSKWKQKHPDAPDYLHLVSGLRNLSHLRPVQALWDISRRPEPEWPELMSGFLERYGYFSTSTLDLRAPSWCEDPKEPMALLQQFSTMPDDRNPALLNAAQYRKYEQEAAKITSRKLRKLLDQHRQLLWYREEMRDHSTRCYHYIRQVVMQLGADAEDYFYLPLHERLTPTQAKQRVKKEKTRLAHVQNYRPPNEIGLQNVRQQSVVPTSGSAQMHGTGCSPGVVRGQVYVARDLADAGHIPAGSILVTRFTDPSWTGVFSSIVGLITETGGVLSHGAVVSRELGIPAVLAVHEATTILKTGQDVIINGSTGEVFWK